jgi:hypothetical protein
MRVILMESLLNLLLPSFSVHTPHPHPCITRIFDFTHKIENWKGTHSRLYLNWNCLWFGYQFNWIMYCIILCITRNSHFSNKIYFFSRITRDYIPLDLILKDLMSKDLIFKWPNLIWPKNRAGRCLLAGPNPPRKYWSNLT